MKWDGIHEVILQGGGVGSIQDGEEEDAAGLKYFFRKYQIFRKHLLCVLKI